MGSIPTVGSIYGVVGREVMRVPVAHVNVDSSSTQPPKIGCPADTRRREGGSGFESRLAASAACSSTAEPLAEVPEGAGSRPATRP